MVGGDELECPNWMDSAFFEDIYKKREDMKGKDFKINVLSCSSVVGIGENFFSKMYRVQIEVEIEGCDKKSQDSLIVKLLNSDMDLIKDFQVFDVEVTVYQDIIPEFERMWTEAGSPVELGAKLLKASSGDNEIIVMSDLKRDGFVMIDRLHGLDEDHVKLTLEKLAKHHAASIFYKEKVGDFPKVLTRKYVDTKMEALFGGHLETSSKSFVGALEKMDVAPEIVDKARKWPKYMTEEMKRTTDPDSDPNDLHVMVHGDLWVNNLMYKLDENGKPLEVMFIDFQIMYWGRPVTDLLYFLVTSVKPELVVKKFDDFIEYYYDNLALSFTKLGIEANPPSLKQFLGQMNKYGFYVTTPIQELLPAVLMETNEKATMENFFSEGENGQKLRELMYDNPRIKKALETFLPFFDKRGWLESDLRVPDDIKVSNLPKLPEMECPTWMDSAFFEDIYKKKEELKGKKLTIKVLSCSSVVGIGENYISQMYRANVEVEVEGSDQKIQETLIVKSMNNTMDMIKDFKVFDVEVAAYQDMIPAFEQMWLEAGQAVNMGPKLLKATTGESEVLVLTDLKTDGYVMMDRFKGLDVDHVELTLAKLAKFHASSVLYKEKNGGFPKNLTRKFVDQAVEEMFSTYIETTSKTFVAAIEKMDVASEIVDKARKWPKVEMEELKITTDPDSDPNDLHVMVHGDLWVNNQMYKLDVNGKPSEVIFIDFQIMYYGRPVTDLFYFLISSVKPELVVEKWDYFIHYYYDNLVSSFATLGIKQRPPSLKNFLIQISKYGFYAVSPMQEILPAVLVEKNDHATIENFFSEDENGLKFRELMYGNPRIKKALETFLPFFDNKGWLESDLEIKDSKISTPVNGAKMECPTWMDSAFFDEIYKDRDDVKGKAYKISIPSVSEVVGVGDNYVSKMYRANVIVDVEGSEKKIEENLVVKSIESTDPFFKEFGVFPIEVEAYQDALPAFEKFWREAGHPVDFGPKCLKATSTPHDVMVLTDLKQGGYVMQDRFKGLDLEHAKRTLSKLAKFHAASVLYQEKNKTFGPRLSRKLMDPKIKEMYHKFMDPTIAGFTEALKSYDLGQELIDKVAKWPEFGFNEMRMITDPESDLNDLHVLVHGDLWLNNQMFKYDSDNNLIDVIFIDFQLSYWGRPATDLFYFLLSSVTPEIIVENYDNFFRHYHDELVAAFEVLKIQKSPPSLKSFLCQVHKCGFSGASALTQVVPIVLMERNEDAKADNFISNADSESGKNMRNKMFLNPRYEKALRHFVPLLNQKGYFDEFCNKDSEENNAPVPSNPIQTEKDVEEPPKVAAVIPKNESLVPDLTQLEKEILAKEVEKVKEQISTAKPVIPISIQSENQTPVEETQNSVAEKPISQHLEKPAPPQLIHLEPKTTLTNGYSISEDQVQNAKTATINGEGHVNGTANQNDVAAKPKQQLLKMSSVEPIVENGVTTADKQPKKQHRVQTHVGPKWMDKFFFADILRKEYDSFKVVTYKVEPATAKGENYASLMYRVNMKVENNVNGLETKSMIAKVGHDTEMSAEMMKEFNVFPKEIDMYNNIIPAFEKMFKAIGEEVQFGPKCFLANTEPADLIILEDLCLQGYRTSDRKLGLDMDHCKLVLEKLAKFHAASAVYHERNGPYKPHFNYGIFAEHLKPIFRKFYEDNVYIFEEVTKVWKYGDLMLPLFKNWDQAIFQKIYSVTKPVESRFNVLTHGDMWSNNVMFKYDESGKPASNLLVDYQMCNYNTPALDLHYFIFTSIQKDIKLEKIDFFVQFYHQHLVANLKKLGYKKKLPTLLALQRDFLDVGFFGLSSAFGTMAVVLAESGDDASMESMLSNDEAGLNFKRQMYSNKRYVEAIDHVLPYFHEKGYLEI